MGNINVQMYSFFDGQHNDWRENFALAKEIGFDGVELFGPCMDIPAAELKALLADLGLEAVSLHQSADKIEEFIPYAKELGLKFMGIGMEHMLTDDAVHAFAGTLNELGEKCAKEGIVLTYHNHTQEFVPCGETTVYDTLMNETNPEYVSFELDAGWAAAAGFDPKKLVQQYSGRIKLIHVKESDRVIGPQKPFDPSKMSMGEDGKPVFSEEQKAQFDLQRSMNCAAGSGIVDWKELKAVADENGCEYYIVERELSPTGDRIADLKADMAFYRTQI